MKVLTFREMLVEMCGDARHADAAIRHGRQIIRSMSKEELNGLGEAEKRQFMRSLFSLDETYFADFIIYCL